MLKVKITTKIALIISGFYSLIFVFFSFYKGSILYLIKLEMEDTFVGGEASDTSIYLWFAIGLILLFASYLFFYLIKIKDLKSQKTLLNGLTYFWILVSIIKIVIFKSYFFLVIFSIIPILVCYAAIQNQKKLISDEKKNKGLSDREIHLLQRLAGRKDKN